MSVTFETLHQDGETSFSQTKIENVTPLPTGFKSVGDIAYNVNTAAIFSGEQIIKFKVNSESDIDAFRNLRLLHLETDPVDPDGHVWVDRTILSPGQNAPDFESRTMYAKSEDLGTFVIARRPLTPNRGITNLGVSIVAPESTVVDNDTTYSIQVKNSSETPATGVGLIQGLAIRTGFVAVSTTQGSCKYRSGKIFCKLGDLNSNKSITITVQIRIVEVGLTDLQQPTVLTSEVRAGSAEIDSDYSDNSASCNITALPNPNARPVVRVIEPATDQIPAVKNEISILVDARDLDGTVQLIEVYDKDVLLGKGVATRVPNQYRFVWKNVPWGLHFFTVTATDNGGRLGYSVGPTVFVNGPATVSIRSPIAGSTIPVGGKTDVLISATDRSGDIAKVELRDDGVTCGFTTTSPFTVSWFPRRSGKHILTANVTNSNGVATISAGVPVIVGSVPTVVIETPTDGTKFEFGSNITLLAHVSHHSHFPMMDIEFFANGTSIGRGSDHYNGNYELTWVRPPEGTYSITATAKEFVIPLLSHDSLEVTSSAVTISLVKTVDHSQAH